MIVIVDYGMGNLGSIANILRRVGADSVITSDPSEIARASKLILPGVGAFDNGMRNLEKLSILPVLNDKALVEQVPVLGICLGMQLLTSSSEEGSHRGLNWIDARTIRFRFEETSRLKIPHMGWNVIEPQRSHVLFDGLENPRFYFVHSYFVECTRSENALAMSHHGHSFCSIVARGNILGTQFHPEKSHKFGMKVLENFVWKFGNATNKSDAVSAA